MEEKGKWPDRMCDNTAVFCIGCQKCVDKQMQCSGMKGGLYIASQQNCKAPITDEETNDDTLDIGHGAVFGR